MKNSIKLFLAGIILTSIVFESCNKDEDDSSNNDNLTIEETCTINGKLFNRETNEAISNAYITFDDRSYTLSASDGSFETEITKGSRLISVFAEDYTIFSSLLEVNADIEFNIALDYKSGAGNSGVVTGTANSTNNSQATIQSDGFFTQADDDGNYSLRLPTGTCSVQARDDSGVSDAVEVTVSNNSSNSVDLTITDNDNCYRGAQLIDCTGLDTYYLEIPSWGSILARCLSYRRFFVYNGGENLDVCIEKVVYDFSDGTPSQTVLAHSGTTDYRDHDDGYFVLEDQLVGLVTVTATITFNDGRTKTEQITRDFGKAEAYCNYTPVENEIRIVNPSNTYSCQLNTGNYGIDVIDDEFGMWFSTTDGYVYEIYFYISDESIPDADFSKTFTVENIDFMFTLGLDEDDTGVTFDEDDTTGTISITRTGDNWEIISNLTDVDGNTLQLSYKGTLNLDPDWG
jgi:hypothetical protein